MRTGRIALFVVVFGVSTVTASAMPDYLEVFRRDPFRRSTVDGCNTCHMSPAGGDERNAFGQAFQNSGYRITALLRAQFPDRFVFPTSQTAGGVQIHFSDPSGKQVVFETGGTRTLVDVETKSVNGVAASTGGGAPVPAPAIASAPQSASAVPVDVYAREGAFLGSHIVNLQNGKPMRAGSVDFAIQHRFQSPISNAGLGGLFGFDSSAVVAYSGRVGLTDRLSVGVLRTNHFPDKTIELSSTFNAARQGDRSPITLAVRGGVEGRTNFHEQYAAFVQPVVTRTFADRVSLTAAPTFAFNTREELQFFAPDERIGNEHNNTIALGLGAGIRFLKTTSVVGEYMPGLWGFRGDFKDRPGLAIGLQKATFRHTFELLISRRLPLTTTQYAIQGNDAFNYAYKVGFNIYRRIR